MRKRTISLLLVLILVVPLINVHATPISNEVELRIPAVAQLPNGTMVGVLSNLTVKVTPGSGIVYFSADPLTQLDTQGSARTAAFVACYILGLNFRDYNFYYHISSGSSVIGGPSAGAAMTVATLAALEGVKLRRDVIMTGMINPDGTIGPVGGIPDKLEAAAKGGAKVFLIPAGQRVVTEVVQKTVTVGIFHMVTTQKKEVDLVKLGEKLGVKVIEVSDITEAFKYFTGVELKSVAPLSKIELSNQAKKAIESWTHFYESKVEELSKKTRSSYGGLSADAKNYIEGVLSHAESLLSESRSCLSGGEYYSAASLAFQATVEAQYAYDLTMYLKNKNYFTSTVKELEKSLNNLQNRLKGVRITTPERLDVLIGAWMRYYKAKEALDDALRKAKQDIYFDSSGEWGAIHEISYVRWRIETASTWLDLYKPGSGQEIDPAVLRSLASYFLYGADTTYGYAESLYNDLGLQGGFLSKCSEAISNAREAISSGNYLAAIGFAVEAISDGTVAIHAAFATNDQTVLSSVRKSANRAISMVLKDGLEPMLAISYYEFAHRYETSSTLDAISLYEDAATNAMVLDVIYRTWKSLPPRTSPIKGNASSNGTSQPQPQSNPQPSQPTVPPTTQFLIPRDIFLLLLVFLVGLVLGIVVARAGRS